MARYSLRIKKSAAKELGAVATKADRQHIIKRIETLRDKPRPVGAIKLSGSERYRLRRGNCRILYTVEEKALIVYVIKVGDRKDVYNIPK